jgi:hypothetical protein
VAHKLLVRLLRALQDKCAKGEWHLFGGVRAKLCRPAPLLFHLVQHRQTLLAQNRLVRPDAKPTSQNHGLIEPYTVKPG